MVKFLQKYIFGDLHILIEKKYRLNIKKQRIELATKTGVHLKKTVDGKCKKKLLWNKWLSLISLFSCKHVSEF